MSTLVSGTVQKTAAIPHAGAVKTRRRRRFHIAARARVAFTKLYYSKLARTVAVWITAALVAVLYGWLAASGI